MRVDYTKSDSERITGHSQKAGILRVTSRKAGCRKLRTVMGHYRRLPRAAFHGTMPKFLEPNFAGAWQRGAILRVADHRPNCLPTSALLHIFGSERNPLNCSRKT